ncbi:hypothetical protein ILYODFUR_017371, partial [Ilyodon furcidens]
AVAAARPLSPVQDKRDVETKPRTLKLGFPAHHRVGTAQERDRDRERERETDGRRERGGEADTIHVKFFRAFWRGAQTMGWCCSGICRALALLVILFVLTGRGCCCWGLNPGSGDGEKSPRSDPDSWEALHRHKRSWVWNQFFVLEEYTGNEPLYVGKVSDL